MGKLIVILLLLYTIAAVDNIDGMATLQYSLSCYTANY